MLPLCFLSATVHSDTVRQYPWEYGHTHCRVGFIYMLTTCTAGPKGIDPDIVLIKFKFNTLLQKWIGIYRGKGCMPFCIRVKRRDTNESVYTDFRPQMTVHIFTLYFYGNTFKARDVSR